ncbi:MAG: PilT/PilU family type 4a pilus ATPase [Actinobacteria bacterium]|nr:PilT/PilU family type 4a pilus ATPase [Actinomycetota bacterium]
MLDLDQLLQHAVEQRASDIHVKVGSRPFLRVDGALRQTPFEVVEPEETERLALGIMPPRRAERFRHGLEADFVYSAPGRGRFRVSAFRQRGWVGLVMRRVIASPPGFDALGLPPGVQRLTDSASGLVLVTGLAGSGRTSTLASILDQINQHRARHIVTIEDPIEVLHPDKHSIVTQREVGTDTESFHEAILHALRQDPDVLFVSRLQDAPTTRAALEAADVGHLVFASLPTVSATDTVTQIIEMFPPHERPQVRGLLARALRGIVCQRLLSRAGGRGRVPAVEVLVVNSVAAEALAEGKVDRLERIMHEGEYYDMQTFDQSLSALYRRGVIEREAALHHATSAPALRVELERIEREQATAPVPSPYAAPAVAPMAPPHVPPPGPGSAAAALPPLVSPGA